jgi:hypothetical protein
VLRLLSLPEERTEAVRCLHLPLVGLPTRCAAERCLPLCPLQPRGRRNRPARPVLRVLQRPVQPEPIPDDLSPVRRRQVLSYPVNEVGPAAAPIPPASTNGRALSRSSVPF